MPYNPNIHHRRSIRLKGYDFSQAGLYFITICKHNRECLFGKIVGVENFLPLQNEFQKMIPRSIGSIIKGLKMGVTKWFRNDVVDSVGVEKLSIPIVYEQFVYLPCNNYLYFHNQHCRNYVFIQSLFIFTFTF